MDPDTFPLEESPEDDPSRETHCTRSPPTDLSFASFPSNFRGQKIIHCVHASSSGRLSQRIMRVLSTTPFRSHPTNDSAATGGNVINSCGCGSGTVSPRKLPPDFSRPNPRYGAGPSTRLNLSARGSGGIVVPGFLGVPEGWRQGSSRGKGNGGVEISRSKVWS